MTVPAYPAYRESGVDWLGPVPRGWAVKRVKHVTRSIEQGWSPQCDGFPVTSEDEWGVLKVGCVNGGRFNPEENKALPAELTPMPELGIAAGDVLISRANTRELVGGAVCVSADHPNLLLCDKLYRLRLNDAACMPQWLAVYLRSDAARGQIELAASGASQSMVNIGQGTILDLPMPLPMRDEQSQILAFLDRETGKIDALVAEQERLIALLKEKRQAVISQAVTKGLDASAPMKDSGVAWLGQVPAHWERYPLATRCAFIPGRAHEPYFDDDGPFACVTARFVSTNGTEAKRCTQNLTPAQRGDILMVMSDLPNGRALARAFLVEDEAGYAVNQRVCIIRSKLDNSRFLYYQLDRNQMLLSNDDGMNQTHLSNHDFTKLALHIPPRMEQDAIAEFLDDQTERLFSLLSEAHRAIALLRERRAALISAAVTGKIDVRGLVTPDEAKAA